MISQPASRFAQWTLTGLFFLGATACSTQPPVSGHPRYATSVGDRAALAALDQLGVPYRYGGSAPDGFDCSGLIQYSYRRAGKSLPRTTAALWDYAVPVDDRNLRAGDLLFFNIAGKMAHVGLYLGDGRFVHAPATGREVSIASLHSDFYRRALIRAGRPH